MEKLPTLLHVQILFLPKNTTARLQPLDAGIIASVKKRYRKRVVLRAVDLLSSNITENLYAMDIRQAMENVYDIWENLEASVIQSCWRKTEIRDEEEYVTISD